MRRKYKGKRVFAVDLKILFESLDFNNDQARLQLCSFENGMLLKCLKPSLLCLLVLRGRLSMVMLLEHLIRIRILL